MALMTMTLKDYFEHAKKDPDFSEFDVPSFIRIQAPVSLRAPVKRTQDVSMVNSISVYKSTFMFKDNFKDQVRHINKYYKQNFSILSSIGLKWVIHVGLMLPFTIASSLISWISNKYTVACSNVNASKVPFSFAGKETQQLIVYTVSNGNNCCSFVFPRTGNAMSLTLFTDIALVKDPKILKDLFNKHYEKEILAGFKGK